MMRFNNFYSYSHYWGTPSWGEWWFWPVVGIALGIIAVWTLVWKGMALWRAAQRREKVWFVILLLVNTLGILEILYLYVFSKKSPPTENKE